MLKPFQENIVKQQLCKTTDKILLAVSGGIDSMVMLHLFHRSGYNIGVAHCNFQLRGKESDGDELFVQQICRQLQIPFFSTRFNTNNYATEHGISIQMAARDLRYQWFNDILTKENFDLLATGHHLTDSVETVFLNLIHGRGLDGLTGISAKQKKTIRPLLFALRADIEKFASDNLIGWREDASNQTTDYKRNQIRHDLFPVLRKLNSGLEHTMKRGMDKNQGAFELLRLGIEAFESKYVVRSSDSVIIHKEGFSKFQHPGAVLYELVKEFKFLLEQCNAVIESLHGQAGKSFFSSTHQLVVDRVDLIITKKFQPVDEILIHKGQQQAVSGNWEMEIIEEMDPSSKVNEPSVVTFDADKLKYPLVWRIWKEGDYFYPLGMDHKKKLSDFLIDRKVALSDKNHVMVLESAGEIFWVMGHQISNRFKITSDSKRVIRFTVRPYFV